LLPKITKAQNKMLMESVLYVDQQVLAINKPAGLAVQGGQKIKQNLDSMLDCLTFDADERPRLVHRLDKNTSGVLVLARNRDAAVMLSEAFRSKQTRKLYWAIVKGVPKPLFGNVDLPLVKKPVSGSDKVIVDKKGKRAITKYRVVENAGRKAAWLALEPVTGRTHQLRVHCNELGTPILGDGKYGGNLAFFQNSVEHGYKMQLHAKAIRIPLANGSLKEISAPLPNHMLQIWQFLGFDEKRESVLFSEDGGK
jgi:23S rRNA pseudouridine955/2504/2580 synthase